MTDTPAAPHTPSDDPRVDMLEARDMPRRDARDLLARLDAAAPARDDALLLQVVQEARRREQECILRMQRRIARNPIRGFLWRRPWRARHGVADAIAAGQTWRVKARNAWQWIAHVHDCSDPLVACTCSGGYRFPDRLGTTTEGVRDA